MTLLDTIVQKRLNLSKSNIQKALWLANSGNPLGAEPDALRRTERFERKMGLSSRAAEITSRRVAIEAREALAAASAGGTETMAAAVAAARDQRERIWGDTIDFVGVSFLERGAQTARSVGRVAFRSGKPMGSGVLIGANLFLTNHHVIESIAEAEQYMVEFDYERDVDGGYRDVSQFAFDPSTFVTDPVEGLDFTIIGIGPRLSGNEEIDTFGWSSLSDARDKHMIGEFANIVQHPNGRYKEVVLRENRLVNRFEDALHYTADTEPGSSGSPVYNSEWQMIAIHHWGGPWLAGGEGPDADFEINEGIRISSIVRFVRQWMLRGDDAVRQRLAKALSLGETNARPVMLRAGRLPSDRGNVSHPEPMARPYVNADGRVSWVVPVELSVRLPILTASDTGVDPQRSNPVPPSERAEQQSEYSNRDGYNPVFLRGFNIPLPRLRESQLQDAAKKLRVAPGEDPYELRYHHFSIVMNRRRKLAFFTACNIDGATSKSINRSTRVVSDLEPTNSGLRETVSSLDDAEADSWTHDPRLSRNDYSGVEIYEGQRVPGHPNPRDRNRILRMFQKGHLIRRLDPAWGDNNQALAAELDTFHWTNAAPQVGFFNQGAADEDQLGTGGGKLWRAAENYVLRNAVAEDKRVSSFTGPIFRDDDRPYRDIRIPGSFFKITVWEDAGRLRALAFIVDQSQVFQEWPENLDAAPEAFLDIQELERVRDFLSTVEEVERITRIDFGNDVRAADIRAGAERQEVQSDADLPFAASSDDLSRIKGIGKTFAQRLNAIGVKNLSQIASWDDDELAEIDEQIGARGAIHAEDWVGQARRLIERNLASSLFRPEEIIPGNWGWADVTTPEIAPWQSIGVLKRFGNPNAGTAWIIGPQTAITAAHAAFRPGSYRIRLPGGEIAVDGTPVIPDDFKDTDREESRRMDIAILHLAEPAPVPSIPLSDRLASVGTVAGYFRSAGRSRFTRNAGPLLQRPDDYLLHQANTERGHSGGPVLVEDSGGEWSAVAVHVGGFERHPFNVQDHNAALLLNGDRLSFIREHIL